LTEVSRVHLGGAADATAFDLNLWQPKRGPSLALRAVALVKRLVTLVPPRGLHLTCFHGVFAPNARLRAVVSLPVEFDGVGRVRMDGHRHLAVVAHREARAQPVTEGSW
jgi:hypothetical protein